MLLKGVFIFFTIDFSTDVEYNASVMKYLQLISPPIFLQKSSICISKLLSRLYFLSHPAAAQVEAT
jgi:hypothetical protein